MFAPRLLNSGRCFLLLLVVNATLLIANGQQQHNNNNRSTLLRSMSQVRSAPATTSSSKTVRQEPSILVGGVKLAQEQQQVDRISTPDLEPRPTLTIQPEDRLKLRQSVMDLNKRRRVTAIKPTMSPDVISTPNVYHFFSKKRFERVRSNLTVTTSPTSSTTEASAPVVTQAA
ncbi:hypothetical protein DAPPUDRAFT_223957 [Daphnia pulex]|uniref:Corticotropin-releasing factor domain-containing protein n=1 Tax=Daphnia pulex TaxID=6669 RepID=E9GET9_DAPPU|nr:hypothetical protein DAPPUDRAFT_223957 [Daphnia pulex]|eukprot:EFX82022.1 hypothetical protein DAPPUDRAFT_223957 [Daphnia pulex]